MDFLGFWNGFTSLHWLNWKGMIWLRKYRLSISHSLCNVWLGLELRGIFSLKAFSDLNWKNVARPTLENSCWPENFGFVQLRQFFSLESSQFWKFQTLLVEILSFWCRFNDFMQCKTPLVRLNVCPNGTKTSLNQFSKAGNRH